MFIADQKYPALNGYYIFADYISNNQWLIKDSSNTWSIKQITEGYQPASGTIPRNIAGFGEGAGRVIICRLVNRKCRVQNRG